MTAWLVQAHVQYGELTITSTGGSYPTLAGNVAAVLTGLLLSFSISIIKPDEFDFAITRTINSASPVATPSSEASESEPREESLDGKEKEEKDREAVVDELPTELAEDREMMEDAEVLRDPKGLQRTFYLALILSCVLSFIMVSLVHTPFPERDIAVLTLSALNRTSSSPCPCSSATTSSRGASSSAGSSSGFFGCSLRCSHVGSCLLPRRGSSGGCFMARRLGGRGSRGDRIWLGYRPIDGDLDMNAIDGNLDG